MGERELILWRFYEGRSLVEMAREVGVPRSTLQSRLDSALAKLRARLERRYGGATGLTLALAPLVGPPAPRRLESGPALGTAARAPCFTRISDG